MKTLVWMCLAVTALFTCFLSAAHGQETNSEWKVFNLSKIKAEASFPCNPKETTLSGLTSSYRFDYRCKSGGSELSVSLWKYSEYYNADSAIKVVDEVEKGLKALGKDIAVLRSEKNVQTFLATVLDVKGATTLRKYIFVNLKKGHLGAAVWQTRQKDQSFEDFAKAFDAASQKFTDSLKILSAK